MSIRKINYYISESEITPSAIQYGGIQGDHNATTLVYNIDEQFKATLSRYQGYALSYRFDVYDGAGHMHQTPPQAIPETISFIPELPLTEALTRHGGELYIFLVITQTLDDGETNLEIYSFPAIIRLKQRPLGDSDNTYRSVTSLADKVAQDEKKVRKYLEDVEQIANTTIPEALQDAGRIPVSSTLPEAKEENRGRMAIVPVDGNDEVYICLLRDGAYTWLNLKEGTADTPSQPDEPDTPVDPDTPTEPDEPDSNEVVLDMVTYVLDDSNHTATVTDCDTSKSGEVIIPGDVNGYSVTAIGPTAFMACAEITAVTIPDSVETIGERAFSNCGKLDSITIPKSVISIGAGAFYCTSLDEVNYGGSESDWNNIAIGGTNDDLAAATIIYGETDTSETDDTIALLDTAILGIMIIGKEN